MEGDIDIAWDKINKEDILAVCWCNSITYKNGNILYKPYECVIMLENITITLKYREAVETVDILKKMFGVVKDEAHIVFITKKEKINDNGQV